MKCVEREELFAYSHQLLEARQGATVRAHLAECARCRAAVSEYGKLDVVLDEWKPVGPTPGFDARLRAAVEERGAAPAASSLWGPAWSLGSLRWLAPALALAIVAVVSVVVLRTRPSHQAPGGAMPQVAHEAAAPSAQVGEPAEGVQTEIDAGEEELSLYKNLSVLEDYDMLADFDMLSDLPKSEKHVDN